MTPWIVAHQAAPLSMELSGQENWSGSSLTLGLNPGLLHCRQILNCLSHQVALRHRRLPSLEMWVIQTEMCCEPQVHTGVQTLSTRKRGKTVMIVYIKCMFKQ